MTNRKGIGGGGFTLVEILTVVALISILFVIFIPRIDFATTRARETGVMSDFHSFQIAIEATAKLHSGFDDKDDSLETMNSYLDNAMKVREDAETNQLYSVKTDPWNTHYIVDIYEDEQLVNVTSAGADKQFGSLDEDASEIEKQYEKDNYYLITKYRPTGISTKTLGFDMNITDDDTLKKGILNG